MMTVLLLWQVRTKQSGSAQLSSSSVPEQINDGDESERVSQMLQRDSLVRGLGIVELVHRLLKSVHHNDPSSALVPVSNEPATVIDRLTHNHVSFSFVHLYPPELSQ